VLPNDDSIDGFSIFLFSSQITADDKKCFVQSKRNLITNFLHSSLESRFKLAALRCKKYKLHFHWESSLHDLESWRDENSRNKKLMKIKISFCGWEKVKKVKKLQIGQFFKKNFFFKVVKIFLRVTRCYFVKKHLIKFNFKFLIFS
jgi:hypothetical protein